MAQTDTHAKTPKQQSGQSAEDLACQYLQHQGLQLLVRNFTCKLGEIDLIMQHNNQCVFVEVRYRKTGPAYGGALASVTPQKQHRIIRTAQVFLQQRQWTYQKTCRFDLVAVKSLDSKTKDLTDVCEWIPNAFQVF